MTTDDQLERNGLIVGHLLRYTSSNDRHKFEHRSHSIPLDVLVQTGVTMPARFVNNQLLCVTDCMAADISDTKYGPQFFRLDHKYEFSLEMVEFFLRLWNQMVNWDELDKKCLKIASRKSCYNPPLLTDFGTTTEEGIEATEYAICISTKISRYATTTHTPGRRGENAKTMSDIVVWGTLPIRAVRLMHYLWDLLPENVTKPKTPTNFKFDVVGYDSRTWIRTASIRTNPNVLAAYNTLFKFGLIDLKDLRVEGAQRGRQPVGFALSEMGRRFYQDFLNNYDPGTMRQVGFERDALAEKPEKPENSQTVIPLTSVITEAIASAPVEPAGSFFEQA